nr:hypothetical protein pmam_210 [Pithovirus mammoth]
MDLLSFISKNSFSGIQTPIGFDIPFRLSSLGPVLSSFPSGSREFFNSLNGVTFSSHDRFFTEALSGKYSTVIFFLDSCLLPTLLKISKQIPRLVLISSEMIPVEGFEWMVDFSIPYPTLISYSDRNYQIGDKTLISDCLTQAKRMLTSYSRIVLLCPSLSFISQLTREAKSVSFPISLFDSAEVELQLLNSSPDSNSFWIDESVVAVLDTEARLAVQLLKPNALVDSCQTIREETTTMGAPIQKLRHRSQDESNSISRLSSLYSPGFCHRMTTEKFFFRFPEKFHCTEIIFPSLVRQLPQIYPEEYSIVSSSNYLNLPLSLKNNSIVSEWISSHPPFSILGPICFLDSFSPSLFVYPGAIYNTNSYLAVVEQHYKTFFSPFAGRDSIETFSNIWENLLENIEGLEVGFDRISQWASNHSISAEKIWQVLQTVRTCISNLEKRGIKVEISSSNSEKVRDTAAPIFAKFYPQNRMNRTELGYDFQGLTYFIEETVLPTTLAQRKSPAVGLIFMKQTCVAAVEL